MKRSSYLLIREDLDRTFYALMSDAEPTRLLSSITLPAGAGSNAVEKVLQSAAGADQSGSISTSLRGDPSSLRRAAGRCAEALGVPVRVLDVAHDAGRLAWSLPGGAGEMTSIAEGALIPADAVERRRRCDAVLQLIGDRDRATVADRLGDIADRPMSGRDGAGDQIRAAACIDAIQSIAERVDKQGASVSAEVLIVTGQLAANLSSGAVPLAALSPLVALGRTTVLLDRAGVLAALGTEQLNEATGADLARATAEQLLAPAGDLLVVADHPGAEVLVQSGAEAHALHSDEVLEFDVKAGETADIEVETEGHRVRATLLGGSAGIGVVRGVPPVELMPAAMQAPVASARPRVLPIDAPLALLPRSASASTSRHQSPIVAGGRRHSTREFWRWSRYPLKPCCGPVL